MAGDLVGGAGDARLGVPGCGPSSAPPRCSGRRGNSGLCVARRRRAVHAQIKIPRSARGGARAGRRDRPLPGEVGASRLSAALARALAPSRPHPRTRPLSRCLCLSPLPRLRVSVCLLCLSALPLSPSLPLCVFLSVSGSLRPSWSYPLAPALGSPARPHGLGLAPWGLVGGLRRKWPMSAENSVLPGAGRRVGKVSQD